VLERRSTVSQLRFGILSFPTAPYDTLARIWRDAEVLGFDSAWIVDDLNLPGYADFEPWALLGALARETSRLRIGTLVTAITFRHPAFLAAQAITLDHLSHGRVAVGLGSGGPPNNYGALGLGHWPAKERLDRLEEQAIILDQLLRGESITYDGRYYRTLTAKMPAPVQRPRPPFIIAAHGPRGMRLAARYADGWNCLGGQPYPQAETGVRVALAEAVGETRRLNALLDTYCSEIGRDPATLRRSVLAYRPEPDPLASLDAFDEYVGRYRELGIDELVLYWPPLDNVLGRQPIAMEQQARFERIATERLP
jgi:alkanesulfonate monooxygenase SsuD/methylene tetrahydromethanopterin reductase-like flavin-dependent oxidoreductase (luciferase family)